MYLKRVLYLFAVAMLCACGSDEPETTDTVTIAGGELTSDVATQDTSPVVSTEITLSDSSVTRVEVNSMNPGRLVDSRRNAVTEKIDGGYLVTVPVLPATQERDYFLSDVVIIDLCSDQQCYRTELSLGINYREPVSEPVSISLESKTVSVGFGVNEISPTVIVNFEIDETIADIDLSHSALLIDDSIAPTINQSAESLTLTLPLLTKNAGDYSDTVNLSLCSDATCYRAKIDLKISFSVTLRTYLADNVARLNYYEGVNFERQIRLPLVQQTYTTGKAINAAVGITPTNIEIQQLSAGAELLVRLNFNPDLDPQTREKELVIEVCAESGCINENITILVSYIQPTVVELDREIIELEVDQASRHQFNLGLPAEFLFVESYLENKSAWLANDSLIIDQTNQQASISTVLPGEPGLAAPGIYDDKLVWQVCDASDCVRTEQPITINLRSIPPEEEVPPPAFEPNPELAAMPDNTAKWLGYFSCPEEAHIGSSDYGACRFSYQNNAIKYNKVLNKGVMFGGGSSWSTQNDMLVFNFATLSWESSYARTNCDQMTTDNYDSELNRWTNDNLPLARPVNDLANIDSHGNYILLTTRSGEQKCTEGAISGSQISSASVVYDFKENTWEYQLQEKKWGGHESSEIDPITGNILVVEQNRYWVYDPRENIIVGTGTNSIELEYNRSLIYYPPNDSFLYFIGSGNIIEIQIDRALNQISMSRLPVPSGEIPLGSAIGVAYDSKHQKVAALVDDGKFSVFDPVTNSWESQQIPSASSVVDLRPRRVSFFELTYSAVDNIYLLLSPDLIESEKVSTWVYKYKN